MTRKLTLESRKRYTVDRKLTSKELDYYVESRRADELTVRAYYEANGTFPP